MIKFILPLFLCYSLRAQIIISGAALKGAIVGTTNYVSIACDGSPETAKWMKVGNVFDPTNAWESQNANEPSVYVDNHGVLPGIVDGMRVIHMVYSAGFASIPDPEGSSTIHLGYAESTNGVRWERYWTNIIGGGQGGASGLATRSQLYVEGATNYIFFTTAEVATAPLWCCYSTGWTNGWTLFGQIIPNTLNLGSPFVIKVGSIYRIYMEYKDANDDYLSGTITNGTILGTYNWETQPTASLNNAGLGSYSVGSVRLVNGLYQNWYHFQPSVNGNSIIVNSFIGRSYSVDGLINTNYYAGNPTNAVIYRTIETANGFIPDQIENPDVIEIGGQSFMFYDSAYNGDATQIHSSICLATNTLSLACTVTDTNVSPLILSYLFHGTVNDSNSFALNGTAHNTPGYTTGPDTIANHAIALDGVSQYVSTPTMSVGYYRGAIVWWQKPNDTFNSGTERMMWAELLSGNEFSCQVFSGDNHWYVGWSNKGTDARVTFAATSGNYDPTAWQYYCLSWDESGSMFWQGDNSGNRVVLLGSNATKPIVGNFNKPFNIGASPDGSAFFNGALSAFSIYQSSLSSNQIYSVFSLGHL